MAKVDFLSLVTTPIVLYLGEKVVSAGTGFYYVHKVKDKEHIFLVTNYHVLTGNKIGNRNKTPKGDRIVFGYHYDADDPSHIVSIRAPLSIGGNNIWLEHTEEVDVVVVPINFNFPVIAKINAIDEDMKDFDARMSPTDKITLVGYPRMFFDRTNALPIYKTGSIASEPEYDFDGKPYFMIDVAAFKGNSGSPAIAVFDSTYYRKDGSKVMSSSRALKFLGIYSAGITVGIDKLAKLIKKSNSEIYVQDEEDLHIGVIWKAEVINEIISGWDADEYSKKFNKAIKDKNGNTFQYKITKGLRESF